MKTISTLSFCFLLCIFKASSQDSSSEIEKNQNCTSIADIVEGWLQNGPETEPPLETTPGEPTSNEDSHVCLGEDLFACYNTQTCVKKTQVCDGKRDCSDGSDELPIQCTNKSNENNQFGGTGAKPQATTKKPPKIVTTSATTREPPEEQKPTKHPVTLCLGNDLPCANGYSCIHPSLRCNGVNNCGDNSDERNCPVPGTTKAPSFSNKNEEIQRELIANECKTSPMNNNGRYTCLVPNRKDENAYITNCTTEKEFVRLQPSIEVAENRIIALKCNPGYSRGQNYDLFFRTKCSRGKWSPTIPECKRTCEEDFFKGNLNLECIRNNKIKVDCRSPFFADTIIRYSCKITNNREQHNPTREIKCLPNGKWSSELPKCSPSVTSNTTPLIVTTKDTIFPTKDNGGEVNWPSVVYFPSYTTKKDVPSRTPAPSTAHFSQNTLTIIKEKCTLYGNARFSTKVIRTGSSTFTVQEISCSYRSYNTPAIENTSTDEFPHMALLGYFDAGGNYQWFCDGSLISENFVLSAAHCKQTDRGTADWVILGNPRTNGRQLLPITEVLVHPNYYPPYNNIALFKFKGPVKFYPSLRPICLPAYRNMAYPENGNLLATTFAEESEQLYKVPVYIDNGGCERLYRKDDAFYRGYETENSLCAYSYVPENYTRIGGPLQMSSDNSQCLWTQVGVHSVAPPSYGGNNLPSVYAKLTNYLDWIVDNVWQNNVHTDDQIIFN